jgi:ornithine cyclodeaminase
MLEPFAMRYPIVTDEQVDELIQIEDVIPGIEEAMREHSKGTLTAPPRLVVDAGLGSLVFTAGALKGEQPIAGFRVYETFPKDEPGHTQLVVSYDGATGVMQGIIVGFRVGVIRTGAIGGVAVKHLAREGADNVAMIGSGTQARSQLVAVNAVRDLEQVRVYSPTRGHRESFSEEMSKMLSLEVTAVESPRDAIEDADIVISATRSKTPVYDADLLEPGMHVTTLGPNLADTNEIEIGVADRSDVIVTDSLAQLDSYGEYTKPYFLSETKHRERIRDLGDVIVGKRPGRESDEDITLFCSVGLAGTEVVVANEVFKNLAGQ